MHKWLIHVIAHQVSIGSHHRILFTQQVPQESIHGKLTLPHECFVRFKLVDEVLGLRDVIERVNDLVQSRIPLLIVQESDDLLRSQVGFVLGSPDLFFPPSTTFLFLFFTRILPRKLSGLGRTTPISSGNPSTESISSASPRIVRQ